MKPLKSTITQIIIIGILLVILFTDYLNPIKEYLPILWTLTITLSILKSLKYLRGNISNELRFLTDNDTYNRIYPFIIGILLVIGGAYAIIFIEEYLIFSLLITLNGLLLIISGFLFIPNGMIWIKDKELISVSGNQKNSIEIKKLQEINLFQNRIIFIDQTQKKYNLDHLYLKMVDFVKISDFINHNLNKKIEIKTNDIKVHES
ncbi:hypothetical protein M0D21_02465 [Aquimarina sp. D1M17]|uniref:hypothetical protein n=1 Tax=Aquimarina acroporae TaxID=2937283 RepID=UPI0020BF6EF6|nr:hypothetical protein [Aquimarina acroporae]MCK8520411.1 hypothetical protein [Aquimarina acroporae]